MLQQGGPSIPKTADKLEHHENNNNNNNSTTSGTDGNTPQFSAECTTS